MTIISLFVLTLTPTSISHFSVSRCMILSAKLQSVRLWVRRGSCFLTVWPRGQEEQRASDHVKHLVLLYLEFHMRSKKTGSSGILEIYPDKN